jgi:thiol-disulfide isomerase/thioredoxin
MQTQMSRQANIHGTLLALAVILAAIPAASAPAPSGISGLWDAVIVVDRAEIPFRFEIAQDANHVQGFFFDGDRKIGSTSGTFAAGTLKLDYDFLNTTLEATLDNGQLIGVYRDHTPGAAPLPLRAHRFVPEPAAAAASAPQVAGNWDMRRIAEEQSAPRDFRTWSLYLRQSGAEVSGAILRVDGDTGTLSGRWKNGQLTLSHFAGETLRPLLFEAGLNSDGTMSITLNRVARFVAVRTSAARAAGIPDPPDPSRYTSVQDPTKPFHFRFPGLDGKIVSDTDARFRGKVVLLAIGGTWCPNCLDEAPFLAELYNKFHAKGLEIVGLSFETDADLALARPHMLSFTKRYSIPYPLLLAGTPDQIKDKLPQLVNFGAYPTSIYLGRDARVRAVHAGFASAATGAEHVRLENEITALVERLLAEPVPGTSTGSSSARTP